MTNDVEDLEELIKMLIEWHETENVDFPYQVQINGSTLKIRINDFPDEPLFSLFRDGKHVADFDDWPSHWKR